jgi:hypothetical protein
MRAIIKACIFIGLAVMCLTANAEDTPEYAAEPPVDDCHYAEHPTIRETVHYKYRPVTHHKHHIHSRHKFQFTNGLSVGFPFASPSFSDDMWPSDDCHCEQNRYFSLPTSSDDITNNLMYYGPLYENRAIAAPCD